MTFKATEFYSAEAAKLSLSAPDIFTEAQPLLPPGIANAQVSLYSPGSIGRLAVDKLMGVCGSVNSYVLEAREPKDPVYDGMVLSRSTSNVGSVIGTLLTKSRTGKMYDLTVEAVAREELLPGMLKALKPGTSHPELDDADRHTVFLMISGMLKATYTPQYRAAIAAVYKNTKNRSGIPSPYYLTASLPDVTIRKWQKYRQSLGQ